MYIYIVSFIPLFFSISYKQVSLKTIIFYQKVNNLIIVLFSIHQKGNYLLP